MKKLITLALTFLGIITITSCSNIETYSLKEAGGFKYPTLLKLKHLLVFIKALHGVYLKKRINILIVNILK